MSIRIGIGLDNFASAGIDADAAAFFARVTAAGGTLSATERTAVDKLVKDMKAANIWTAMKAVYPMVGASAAACAQNLKSSSFTGTFNGGWTYASTGVTPNGTNAFMNTNLNPSTALTLDSTHLSFYSRTNIISSQVDIGSQITPNRFSLEISYTGSLASDQYNQTTGRVSGANANSLGYYVATRSNSSTHKVFKNNSQFGATNTGTSGFTPNLNVYVCALNASGTAMFFSTKQCAFASFGDGLSDTNASDLYTAVQAFQTTLSRQV